MGIIGINKPRAWNGNKLGGEWHMTLKVDGVRAIWHDEQGWLSRANTPLYNIPPWRQDRPRDCEVFVETFRDTIRATRTKFVKEDTPSIQLGTCTVSTRSTRGCVGAR
jgi:hypothetical protein